MLLHVIVIWFYNMISYYQMAILYISIDHLLYYTAIMRLFQSSSASVSPSHLSESYLRENPRLPSSSESSNLCLSLFVCELRILPCVGIFIHTFISLIIINNCQQLHFLVCLRFCNGNVMKCLLLLIVGLFQSI